MATGSSAIHPPAMEGDEARKGNTDCVYFLASPLTCKKGSECEYRHSDSARLNPRSCWYWLSGSCLNPNCAFRHPPLEGFTDTTSNSLKFARQTPALTKKSNTPCYFYFNAYCIKGDHCPFMHDPFSAQNIQNQAPDAPTMEAPETKNSTGSNTGSAPMEVQANSRQETSEVIKHCHSKEVPQPLSSANIFKEPTSSAESSRPDSEEQPAVRLDKLFPAMRDLNRGSNYLQDQNMEKLVEECLERDEWREFSPGFDVLVDAGSEQQTYQDETEYVLTHGRESEELHTCLFQYGFKSSAGHDPSYPDIDHNLYDSYDQFYSRSTPDYFRRDFEDLRMIERISEPLYHRKRRPSCMDWEMGDRDVVDLRDHLRRRRMDVLQPCWRSMRPYYSQNRHGSRVHRMRCSPNGRLASEIGENMIFTSFHKIEPAFLDSLRLEQLGYSQHSRHTRSRLRERGRWRRQTNPYASTARSSTHASDFTGPKSLAQIREEKSRTKLHMSQCPARTASDEFAGPKPLTELLKHKKRPLPVTEDIKQDHLEPELNNLTAEKKDGKCESDFE
ncbi:hypothetical protein J5N97_006274 [Dioscorea zingiberensis]|uniref:C3H1-type domain-containing protein n=1 Tax=Dioscorea zingiberensis TaxID=325984 RepID=A0A9D5HT85_9LILI|nr:hypothetical protein J5N97_006274 [Dioscorea zingiberensis]